MKDKDMLIIKPILMTFLSTSAVKNLIIQLLEAYAKSTDNTIDDKAVTIRDRDTMQQDRIAIDQLVTYLGDRLT